MTRRTGPAFFFRLTRRSVPAKNTRTVLKENGVTGYTPRLIANENRIPGPAFPEGRLVRLAIIICLLCGFLTSPPSAEAEKSPYDWAYIHLDYIRQEKIKLLNQFTDRMHRKALAAASDKTVRAFFEVNRQVSLVGDAASLPGKVKAEVALLREQFNRYYIENYLSFYDILFVDIKGTIFYSLRKMSDQQTNLTAGEARQTPLGACISARPSEEKFVDFHDYGPAAEPASFFVEPIRIDKEQVGWLIFQLAINKLNSIFAGADDMGQTGETFLVNKQGLMLTDSYFRSHPTILRERLADKNVRTKFRIGRGRLMVQDYRSERSLSSFEVVKFMGAEWLVVAKMDVNEVITDHYKRHRRYFQAQLLERLPKIRTDSEAVSRKPGKRSAAFRVDMDEFIKADRGESLETWGVSTCTAYLAALPGRFAYLAHISPKDKAYGGSDTHIVSQILKKLQGFDIYPSERHSVYFAVVAPHLDSLVNIIGSMLNRGFFLSQIHFFHKPEAEAAAVVYDYRSGDMTVTWKFAEPGKPALIDRLDDGVNIGNIVEQIIFPNKNADRAAKQ